MPVEIRVPPFGESILEATVRQWLKRVGDPVTAGDAVVELETEKVNVEVAAELSGVLTQVLKREGENVRVGETLGLISESAAPNGVVLQPPTASAEEPPSGTTEIGPLEEERKTAAPSARRLAEEYDLDLTTIVGTGPGGRVTREDVLSRLPSAAPPAAPAKAAPGVPPAEPTAPAPASTAGENRPEERVHLSRRRLTIARRLVEAHQTAAMLTSFNEIDMSAVIDLRRRRGEDFRSRHRVGLGYMSFFTKAVVAGLKAFPWLNAEIVGDEMVIKYYYDIGIAVGAEEGLVVPVVRNAERKNFAEIETEIAALAERAHQNRLTLEDLRGGTFTITNGGVFGSLLSTPMLNVPQVGILGMHKIEERPVAINGQVVIRPMMYVALTYDHRLIDGREAVQFLVRIKGLIEDPEALLLEV